MASKEAPFFQQGDDDNEDEDDDFNDQQFLNVYHVLVSLFTLFHLISYA